MHALYAFDVYYYIYILFKRLHNGFIMTVLNIVNKHN